MTDISTTNVPQEIERKILTAIELKKQLAQYETEIKEELLEAMQEHDIKSIKNDKYTITLAQRNNFKAEQVPDEFAKTSLDTRKVGKHYDLYGELPEGVTKTTTKYVTWRAK